MIDTLPYANQLSYGLIDNWQEAEWILKVEKKSVLFADGAKYFQFIKGFLRYGFNQRFSNRLWRLIDTILSFAGFSFLYCWNTDYLENVMFVLENYHKKLYVVTVVKYGRDSAADLIYTYTYTYTYTHTYTHTNYITHTYAYKYMHTHTFTYTFTYTYVHAYVYVYI